MAFVTAANSSSNIVPPLCRYERDFTVYCIGRWEWTTSVVNMQQRCKRTKRDWTKAAQRTYAYIHVDHVATHTHTVLWLWAEHWTYWRHQLVMVEQSDTIHSWETTTATNVSLELLNVIIWLSTLCIAIVFCFTDLSTFVLSAHVNEYNGDNHKSQTWRRQTRRYRKSART